MLCTVVGLPFDVSSVAWSFVSVECWLLFVGCVVVCGVFLVYGVRCVLFVACCCFFVGFFVWLDVRVCDLC